MKPLLGDENWGEDCYIDSLQKNEKETLVKHRERKERRRKKERKVRAPMLLWIPNTWRTKAFYSTCIVIYLQSIIHKHWETLMTF